MTIHILLTGASRGIGAAIAERLSKQDISLVATSSKDGDLADPDTPERLWAAALGKLDGRIDILINNAGVFEDNPLSGDDTAWRDGWNRTMQINLTASAILCRLAVLHW